MNNLTSTIIYCIIGSVFALAFYKAYRSRHGHRDIEKETPGGITIDELINQF